MVDAWLPDSNYKGENMLLRERITWPSLIFFFVVGGFAQSGYAQKPIGAADRTEQGECVNNVDQRYERFRLLRLLEETLEKSVPAYKQFPHDGFFVFDLVDLGNYFIPSQFAKSRLCVDFVEGHIYHFAPISLINSESHFAILSNGKVELFRSVNCSDGDTLDSIRSRIERLDIGTKQKRKVLDRLLNYRKFGFYVGIDEKKVACS